jgi:hypothetical protein
MNERIIEMAIQAGFNPVNCTGGNVPLFKKFAELIVKECIDICDAYGMPDGTSQTAMILSAAIKRKFGVK